MKLGQLVSSQAGAQRPLTRRQRALVDALVTSAADPTKRPLSIAKAAEAAGYAKGNSGRVVASRTLRLPQVAAYLYESVAREMGLTSLDAFRTLRKLTVSAKSEYVQLEAAKDVLDRTGFKPPDRKDVRVAGDVSVHIDLSD